jgi:FMN-dependent oxidoreductase (nitrilotriacetate monooxygenase family)
MSPMMKTNDVILFWMPVLGGFHVNAWRDSGAAANAVDFAELRRQVQLAERGKFHACFIADSLAVGMQGAAAATSALSHTSKAVRIEPITTLSALAVCTDRIGLLATSSTTYNEPYHVARMFASLDHISAGRAGWNVVTSAGGPEAANFGREQQMAHAERYARAQEFFEVVTGLWDSWEDDAFVRDAAAGLYFDPDKLHAIDHRGEYLTVAGPMNFPRPLQGRPVIAQAGSSGPGLAFAARNADVVYTLQADIERGRQFYAELKEQVLANGRDPDHVKILPALKLIVGRTQSEAEERLARLDALTHPDVGLQALKGLIEFDLSDVPLDGPVPEIPETELGNKTRQKYYLDLARRDNLTVRQLMHIAMSHDTIAGSAHTIANLIQEWVDAGAADGINVTFTDSAESLEVFVDAVIPELQRRGVFQTQYRGTTLRESLGLPQPANQFAPALR